MAKETRELIATLEERQSYTVLGALSGVALVLFQFIIITAFSVAAKSAVQEASIGTVWIAVMNLSRAA